MSYVTGTSPIVARLLELLGLKDRPIKSFTFRCESRGAMTVEFEEYATDDKTGAVLGELVKQGPFMLTPVPGVVPTITETPDNALRYQIEDYMDRQIDKLCVPNIALAEHTPRAVLGGNPESFSSVLRRAQSEYRERLADVKSAKLRGDCEMGVDPGEEKKGEAGLGEPAEYLPAVIRKACEAARDRIMAATNPVPMRVDPVIAEVARQNGGQVPDLMTYTMSWSEFPTDPTAGDGAADAPAVVSAPPG